MMRNSRASVTMNSPSRQVTVEKCFIISPCHFQHRHTHRKVGLNHEFLKIGINYNDYYNEYSSNRDKQAIDMCVCVDCRPVLPSCGQKRQQIHLSISFSPSHPNANLAK